MVAIDHRFNVGVAERILRCFQDSGWTKWVVQEG